MNEQEIFQAAIEKDPESRSGFLSEVCAGDNDLLGRVENLVRLNEQAGNFFDKPAAEILAVEQADASELISNPLPSESQIGPYKIREKIGEGGMGVVYVAEQTEPVQRKVALKIIKPGMDTKEVIARFEAERQALAFMEHPNIARVLDAGTTDSRRSLRDRDVEAASSATSQIEGHSNADATIGGAIGDYGRPYFVMELVRGIPITEYCDQVRATPRERLELFQTVCDAVQHAHQKGIIHRDIKPSNVLVTQVSAKPVVKVIDFGLAKAVSGQRLTEKTLYTGFMKLMGTPAYMSPEQAGLSGLDVDTRSDIYSLGVLLYELLTGTTPLQKTDIEHQAYDELCRQIREGDAPKPSTRFSTLQDAQRSTVAEQRQIEPRELRQLLNGDLDLVVLKAIEKDRDRRYGSPQDLAADVERFLDDKPVQAVPPSPWYLTRKYLQRYRAFVLTASSMVCLLVIATVFSSWQALRATKANRIAKEKTDVAVRSEKATREALRAAEDARIEAVTASEQRRRLQYAASMQLADQLWHSPHGKTSEIQELLVDWFPTDEKVDLRDFTWRHHWTRLHHGATHSIRDTSGVSIAPDGNLVVANGKAIRKWDDEGKSFTWLRDLPINDDDQIRSLSPCGRWAAVENVKASDSGLRIIGLASGDEICNPEGNRILFSSDGQFALTWRRGPDEVNEFWHIPTGKRQSLTQEVSDYLGTQHGSIRGAIGGVAGPFLSFKTGLLNGYLSNREEPFRWVYPTYVLCTALSPDEQLIADGKYGGDVHVRLISSPNHAIALNGQANAVSALAFSLDSTQLAVGSREGAVDIWDISDIHDLNLDSSMSDGSDFPTAQLKRVNASNILHSFKGHLEAITSIVFAPDGLSVATRDKLGVAKLWKLNPNRDYDRIAARATDLYGGKTGVDYEQRKDRVRVGAVDANWHDVVRGEVKKGDYVVGVTNQDGYHEIDKHMDATDVQFLDQGPLGEVSQLHLKTAITDEPRIATLRRRFAQVPNTTDLVVHPDGTGITISDDNLGAVGLTTSGEPRKRYPIRGSSVTVSQQGHLLAFDGWRDLYVWDTRSDELLARFACRVSESPTPDNGYFGSLVFSPDGKHIAMGTGFRFNDSPIRSDLRVWEIATRTEISNEPLLKSERIISNLAFSSNGKQLFALTHDGTIRIWDVSSWSQLKRTLRTPVVSTAAMKISPDDKVIGIGGGNGLALLDVESGDSRHMFREHDIYDVAFSSDGRTLVATTNDRKAMLLDAESGMLLTSLLGHDATVVACDFTQENDKLVTVDQNSNLRIWQALSLMEIDADPASHAALYQLGRRQIQDKHFALAEQTLSYLLRLQQEGVLSDPTDVEETKVELIKALQMQGKFSISRQPQTQVVQHGDQWHQPREWESLKADNTSGAIFLESGKRYWVEAHHKEGGGDDHFAVTWQMPDKPPPKNGATPIPGDFLEFQIERSCEP